MKLKNRLFAAALSFVMLLGLGVQLPTGSGSPGATVTASAAAPGDVFYVEDFYYTVENNKVTLLYYSGSNENVVFPNTIEGKRVTKISMNIFGESAGNVKSVTIPSNIEYIEEGAFRNCYTLEDVKCANNNHFTFSKGMLFYTGQIKKGFWCGPLGSMPMYDESGAALSADEGYDSYGTPAFTVQKTLLHCTNYSAQIEVPNGVDAIGAYAFYDPYGFRAKTSHIILSTTVKYIGAYAFFNCAALQVMSPTQSPDGSVDFNIPLETRYIGEFAFAGCSSIRSLNLPENLCCIGNCAFLNCGNLCSAYIPDNVLWLGAYSFGFVTSGYCETMADIAYDTPEKKTGFFLMSKTAMSENGDYTLAAQYAQEQGMVYIDEEAYQNSDLDGEGNHTGEHGYAGDDGVFYSYDVVKFHDPNNDFDHDYAYTAFVAPTCLTPGAAAGVCYCGHTYYYEAPALGHSYVLTVVPPTCTEEGYTAYICTRCGVINDAAGITDFTEPTEHTYVDFVTAATCTAGGYTEHICKNCGDSYIDSETSPTEHNYNAEVTTPATCKSTGVMTYTCPDCGDTKTETIAKNPNNHTGDTEIRNAVAATCEEDGYTGDTYCKGCGVKLSSGAAIPATDHNWGAWTKYSATYHQRVCANDETHVEKAKHTWNSGKVTKAATCTADGVKTYTCTACKATKTETIEKLGHNYSTSWTIDKAATCTAAGSKSHHCTRCTAKKDVTSIPAKGHTWDDGKVTTAATTTAEGVKTFTCTVCGATKTEAIPKALAKIAVSAANAKTGMKLSWKKDANADGYYIFRKAGTGSYKTLKKIEGSDTLSYIDTTAVSGTKYTYAVRSYRGTEKGAYTAKSITRLSAITPTLANGKTGMIVKWAKAEGATGYYVFRKAGSGSYKTLKKIENADTLSYIDTTATAGVKYTYAVRAYKSTTKGAYTAKSMTRLAPVTPTLTNLSSGIYVKWAQVTGATGYYVYRKAGSGSYSLVQKITDGATVTFTDTAVKDKNGVKYTYVVKAYRGTTKSAYTAKAIYRLTGVAISSATNAAAGSMTVNWAQNAKATGYQIQYATNSKFTSAKIVTVSGASTLSKTIASLTKGSTYFVRVRVYKTVSSLHYFSAWSTAKSVKIVK